MKRTLFIAVFILAGIAGAMAQQPGRGPGGRREMLEERVEAQRVAFITQRLQLSAEEAQLFWPMYNEYEAELKTLKEKQPVRPEIMKMSDAEAEAYLEATFQDEQAEIELRRRYMDKFKRVIPIQKVAMLGHVERAFNRELLKRVQEARRN